MMREPTLTQRLAGFSSSLGWAQVPDAVKSDAVRRVVDAVGVGLAGSTSPYAAMVLEVAAEYGGRDEATAWGSGRGLPAAATSAAVGLRRARTAAPCPVRR